MKGCLYVGKEYRGFRSRRRGGRMETVEGGERAKARVSEVLERVMWWVGRRCGFFEQRIRGVEGPGMGVL